MSDKKLIDFPQSINHNQDYCRNSNDKQAQWYCEDIISQRNDTIEELCCALREVYALCGEDKQVAEIVNLVLEKYDT